MTEGDLETIREYGARILRGREEADNAWARAGVERNREKQRQSRARSAFVFYDARAVYLNKPALSRLLNVSVAEGQGLRGSAVKDAPLGWRRFDDPLFPDLGHTCARADLFAVLLDTGALGDGLRHALRIVRAASEDDLQGPTEGFRIIGDHVIDPWRGKICAGRLAELWEWDGAAHSVVGKDGVICEELGHPRAWRGGGMTRWAQDNPHLGLAGAFPLEVGSWIPEQVCLWIRRLPKA